MDSLLALFTLPETWLSLLTLTLLEIILGIDNLVFISVISTRLVKRQQKSARQVGLMLACITRLLLLATIIWMTHFIKPIFSIFGHSFSGRDLVLLGGGLFLIAKSTNEIHLDVMENTEKAPKIHTSTYLWVLVQIMLLDIIFSLDSVITAVGLAKDFIVMALAIIIAVLMMIIASEPLSRFILAYPSLKMLALSFLLLVGVALVADGFGFYIPREYLYFAISFSLFVEILNLLAGRKKNSK